MLTLILSGVCRLSLCMAGWLGGGSHWVWSFSSVAGLGLLTHPASPSAQAPREPRARISYHTASHADLYPLIFMPCFSSGLTALLRPGVLSCSLLHPWLLAHCLLHRGTSVMLNEWCSESLLYES